MGNAVSGRRTLLSGTAALAAVTLIALGAAPALADETEPDLGVGGLAPVTGIAPGDGFGLPVSVLNKGTETVPKVYLTYSFSPGVESAETYSNCVYFRVNSYDERPERNRAVCTVDQPLKPGVLYGTEKPLGLKAGASALYDNAGYGVSVDEPAPDDGGESDHVPGTGAPLKLVERGEATETDRAAHAQPSVRTDVTADSTADFALTGAELKGKVGDKVTAQVKFANKGPAWVQGELDTSVTTVDVRIPAGTSVVKANGFCSKVTATHYTCGTSQSWVHPADGETYPFVLRIDKAVGRTTGKVSFSGQARPFDRNAANDTAEIVVETGEASSTGGTASTGGSGNGGSDSDGGTTATGGTTSGSSGSTTGGDPATTGSATTSAGGSTTGGTTPQTGGSLAATGSDSTLPLAGLAGAAVLAGGGLFHAMRRRTAARNG
ncbi:MULTISPECIES: LPXTG cell wall anchor domain-containing protein [unclassified Streptomyces]|uniref:LPXTG cell wall anchor domain-containing protein n=1 Tax=unclassified Streptomyces TaxID=2593676 RepID=UPI00081E6A7E|nr:MULTISPECIES: LPXTG cell wall anchor domain-containing protein [unclassified Streptomyces]MYR97004.1 LPXTG cell wall anchor domain-containing protein [Streptomyces sp. SID4937]SCE19258.1 LPXTG-motif cell wall anchor domain-containing protein [Streptomyces sp. ScaeMP-e83]